MLVVALMVAAVLSPGESRTAASSAVGRDAPVFTAPTVDGGRFDLGSLLGEPLLLNFWGSWCAPCRKEFPRLAEHHRAGLAVVGVLFKDKAAPAAAFIRDQGAAWPSVLDPEGQVAGAYAVTLAPATIAVDADGVIRARHLGEASDADLAALAAAATAGSDQPD